MSVIVGEVLQDVRDWWGGPPGCLRVIGRLPGMSRSGREAIPDVRDWSEGLS